MNATDDDQDNQPRQPGLRRNADEQAAAPELTRNKADGMTPGEILREGRLAHDYSIDDLCAQTKLGAHTVEALEDNDFDALSQPVFARGYYRQCAKVLDLDVDRLMAAYTAIAGEPPKPAIGHGSVGAGVIPQDVTPGRGFRFRGLFVLLVMAVLVIAIIVFVLPSNGGPGVAGANGGRSDGQVGQIGQDSDQRATTFGFNASNDGSDNDQGAVDNNSSAATAGSSGQNASGAPDGAGHSSGQARTGRQPSGRNVNETLGISSSAQDNAQSVNAHGPVRSGQPAVPPNRLVLTFNKRSWVRVTDANGNRVASGLFEAGDKKACNGKPPYKITLGFAPGVKATIGGEPVDIASQTHSGTIAHLTVDAPDDNG